MKIVAVLKQPKPAAKVMYLADSIVDGMTDNPWFPSPTPPLTTVTARIAALGAANATVLTRRKGAREARDVELVALRADLEHLKAYVQSIADANPAEAASIVASAQMGAKRPSIRNKPLIRALQGPVEGSATLIAKSAGDRASYVFRYSTDQKSWLYAPRTNKAKIVIDGLSPVTRYYFQVCITLKDGPGDWGQIVGLVVS
jgi:hypothetical protein